ncbi:MAG: metallophosphoesterase family protein [Gemmatimonadota bacterium]
MTRLLQISDLHFGPKFLPEVAEGVFEAVARFRPDAIVVSGDFTQRARRDQFAAAAAFLHRFDVPTVVTPGNHDVPLYRVWERALAPYRLYHAHITPHLDHVVRFPGAVIVALNSTRRLTLTNGRIRRWQLDFVRDALRDAPPEAARVLVTHHHLAPPPDFEGGNVMPRAKRALRAFSECGVEVILAGHMHRSYIGSSLDFLGRERDHRGIVVVQCGTTTSSRGRGRERFRNTLNLVEIERERLRIVHALWEPERRIFAPASEHVFPRGQTPYLA